MPTQHEAQQRMIRAVFSALDKMWPMSPATRRAAAEAIVYEIHNSGVRVELERRSADRVLPPLVPVAALFCTSFALERLSLLLAAYPFQLIWRL